MQSYRTRQELFHSQTRVAIISVAGLRMPGYGEIEMVDRGSVPAAPGTPEELTFSGELLVNA